MTYNEIGCIELVNRVEYEKIKMNSEKLKKKLD